MSIIITSTFHLSYAHLSRKASCHFSTKRISSSTPATDLYGLTLAAYLTTQHNAKHSVNK